MSLRALVDLLRPQLDRAAARMWAAEPALERYRRWLCVTHGLVRATAPLLAEAATECVRRGDGTLATYYAHQLGQEYGHDRWVEQDWVATGADLAELTGALPSPTVARLAGAQYYWLRHTDPVALTGHIAVLEWHPPRAALVPVLMRRTGLPERAFTTLARHADLDTGHGADLDDLLDRLPLTAARRRLVVTSALTTAHGLVDVMTDLGGGP